MRHPEPVPGPGQLVGVDRPGHEDEAAGVRPHPAVEHAELLRGQLARRELGLAAATLPKDTPVAAEKLLPVKVMTVPPPDVPEFGLTPVTAGAGAAV